MTKRTSESFPRSHRIVQSSCYRMIYEEGEKIHSEKFVLFGLENEKECPRLGITVSRKIGCASRRNRIKRLLREIFRRSSAEIPGNFDLVVNAKAGCGHAGYLELKEEFLAAVRKLAQKLYSQKERE